MKILLVSATRFEIAPLLKLLKKIRKSDEIETYRIARHTVDVLVTGAGMTATAFSLGKHLNKKYDLAINAGVAGSFHKDIPLGTVVNVTEDRFGDFGAEDGKRFLTAEEIGLVRSQKLRIRSQKGIRFINPYPRATGITVNTVHGNAESIRKVVRKFNPDVESMEGAAFFFACQQVKVPAIQFRAISNYVEKRNKKKWKLALAAGHLSLFLREYFRYL